MMHTFPAEYVAARRTLLDALDALGSHRISVVLIGAQAVYFHTAESSVGEPPMTTDADLALNTDLLADDPEIAATMLDAGFKCKQPGHWENELGIAVDLMVAPHQSHRTSAKARAAHLDAHDRTVARIGPGLAPALTDSSLQDIKSLDPTDTRMHKIRVAGPAALLIAKLRKIRDRLADAELGNSKRIVDKDALDVLRLLQACSLTTLTQGLSLHTPGTAAYEDVVAGIDFLRLNGAKTTDPLPLLAQRAARDNPAIAPSFVVLAQELLEAIPERRAGASDYGK